MWRRRLSRVDMQIRVIDIPWQASIAPQKHGGNSGPRHLADAAIVHDNSPLEAAALLEIKRRRVKGFWISVEPHALPGADGDNKETEDLAGV